MIGAPPDGEATAEDSGPAPAMNEGPLTVSIFWPALTTVSGGVDDAARLTSPGGHAAMVDPVLIDGPLPPLSGSAVVGRTVGGQPVVTAGQAVPAGLAIPPATTHIAPHTADPVLPVPDLPASPVDEVDAVAPSVTDPARPSVATPGLAMAAAGMRFWQTTPPPEGVEGAVSVPQTGPDALLAGFDGEVPATVNSPPHATIASPTVLVARLAETALQSLFAAQVEAARQEPDDLGGLGFTPSAPSTLPGAVPFAAIQAATIPQLAGQLVQTLSQRPDGTTEIALSPDELGHVRVTLQADAQNPDRIVLMLTFDRPETLDLFRRHADQLAEALRDAGFAGADIGFGRSDGGDNRDARPEVPSPGTVAEGVGSADTPAGPGLHQPTIRLATTSTLDLRL